MEMRNGYPIISYYKITRSSAQNQKGRVLEIHPDWEYFQKVKMNRGDSINSKNNYVRTVEYFRQHDQGDTYNFELRDLVIAHKNT